MSLIEASATLAPYMIAVGNHEQNYVTGGAKDPSGPPFVPFRPPWGNYGDSSGGECGVTTYYNFHMPDNGHGIWWYVFIMINISFVSLFESIN